MTEFWIGFFAGVIGIVAPLLAWSIFYVGFREDEPEIPEYQPDIRLTKIKSEHVRAFDVERD